MMKSSAVIVVVGVMIPCLASCGGMERKATAELQQEEAASEKPHVEVVYSSPVAAGKPDYINDNSREGPLRLLDGRKKNIYPFVDQVDIADIGAFIYNGQRQRSLSFINFGTDTLIIDSVLLPDNRFEAEWQPRYKFPPQWSSGIILYGDEKEYVDDYKIVIVYKNEGIAPQTLHVNIHPDIHKLHADYAASQAE